MPLFIMKKNIKNKLVSSWNLGVIKLRYLSNIFKFIGVFK
jgi:hypothetical protein